MVGYKYHFVLDNSVLDNSVRVGLSKNTTVWHKFESL